MHLTPEQKRYVAVETAIGIAIGVVLSAFFFWLVFGHDNRVLRRDLLLDAVPQSFMLTLMTVLVPTLITRKRVARGKITPIARAAIRLPANSLLRALMVAALVIVPGVLATAAFLILFGLDELTFPAAIWFKMLYGALLASIVAPIGLQAALADVPPSNR